MKKILITGSVGQLGSKLMSIVGNDAIGLDKEGFTSINCDLLNQIDLEKIKPKLQNIDTLVHLASIVQDSKNINNLRETIELNVLSTVNILKALPDIKYLIFASSMMVYGIPQTTPVSESHPTDPNNLYGISKLYTEHLLRVHQINNPNLQICILRFTSIYGPGKYSADANRAIPNFIKLAKNNNSPIIFGSAYEKRDYLFIDDAITAILKALEYRTNSTINIGSGYSITIKKLADLICKLTGSHAQPVIKNLNAIRDDYLLDNTLAKKLINFLPLTDIETGIKKEIYNV